MQEVVRDRRVETEPALQAHYPFILRLVPSIDCFPRRL